MTGDSSVIDPSADENVHAQARGQPRTHARRQSPRMRPRTRDGALVASPSGRAARAHDRLAVMSVIFVDTSSRHSASAVAQEEHWQKVGQPPHSHVRARLRGG